MKKEIKEKEPKDYLAADEKQRKSIDSEQPSSKPKPSWLLPTKGEENTSLASSNPRLKLKELVRREINKSKKCKYTSDLNSY